MLRAPGMLPGAAKGEICGSSKVCESNGIYGGSRAWWGRVFGSRGAMKGLVRFDRR